MNTKCLRQYRPKVITGATNSVTFASHKMQRSSISIFEIIQVYNGAVYKRDNEINQVVEVGVISQFSYVAQSKLPYTRTTYVHSSF